MSYAEKMQPIIEEEINELGALLKEKTEGYGPSWQTAAEVLKSYFPEGIPLEAYEDALLMVRVLDKLQRLANALTTGRVDGESPWQDIAGYGIVGVAKERFKASSERREDGPSLFEKPCRSSSGCLGSADESELELATHLLHHSRVL